MGAVEDTCKSSARGVLPSAMSAASHLRTLAVVILESKQRILVLGKNGYEPECQKWPHDFLLSYPFSVFEGHIYIYIYVYISNHISFSPVFVYPWFRISSTSETWRESSRTGSVFKVLYVRPSRAL